MTPSQQPPRFSRTFQSGKPSGQARKSSGWTSAGFVRGAVFIRKVGEPATVRTGAFVKQSAKLPLIHSSFSPRSLRLRRRSKTLSAGLGNRSSAGRICASSGRR